jgi:hypothetical protein
MSGKGIGIPVKLMHESEGHTITVSGRSEGDVATMAHFNATLRPTSKTARICGIQSNHQ